MSTWAAAVRSLRGGYAVSRHSWPEGCFLVYVPAVSTVVAEADPLGTARPNLVGSKVLHGEVVYRYIHGVLTPWLPGGEALMADDWLEVRGRSGT